MCYNYLIVILYKLQRVIVCKLTRRFLYLLTRYVFIHEKTTYTISILFFVVFFFIFVRFRFVIAAPIFHIVSDGLNIIIIIKDTLQSTTHIFRADMRALYYYTLCL